MRWSSIRPGSRHLLFGGLGLWAAGFGGALTPAVLRVVLYPNQSRPAPFALAAAEPLWTPLLWTGLVVWCLSWALVAGYLAEVWAARQGRPGWAYPTLLLVSLASPLAFAFATSILLRLATRGAYHVEGLVPFLPAVLLQLLVSSAYALLTGPRSRVQPLPAAGSFTGPG